VTAFFSEEGSRFFEAEVMESKLHQLHKLCHHFSFKKMMRANYCTSFNALNFLGAAKASRPAF
jgi:hypothetical protein